MAGAALTGPHPLHPPLPRALAARLPAPAERHLQPSFSRPRHQAQLLPVPGTGTGTGSLESMDHRPHLEFSSASLSSSLILMRLHLRLPRCSHPGHPLVIRFDPERQP
jgi:hypothetical protein